MSICVHGLSVLHMHPKHHSNFAFQNILHIYQNYWYSIYRTILHRYVSDFLIRTCAEGKCIRQGLGEGPNSLPLEKFKFIKFTFKFHKNIPRSPPPPPENKIIFRHPPLHWKFFILDQRMYNNNFIYSLTW